MADIAAVRAELAVFGLIASDLMVSRLIDTLARDKDKVLAAINMGPAGTCQGVEVGHSVRATI